MILSQMNTELFSRISQIKQYITTLSQHISANNPNTSNVINKFKKVVMKQDFHQHPHQFVLQCLKQKNQKLLLELEQLQLEKKNMQAKISQNRTNHKDMKEVQVGIFITRLTVSLNQVKKVQYDEVSITCNYQLLTINSLVGNKYKGFPLSVESISNLENKSTYVYMQYQDTQKLNVLVRFKEERELLRWVTGIKFGILIETSKKREKLFQVKKEEQITPNPTPTPTPQIVTMSQIPPLQFKQASPSESIMSMIEEKKDKSLDRSFQDKMEKNTERSLVNALTAEKGNEKKKFPYQRDSIREQNFGRQSGAKDTSLSPPAYKYQASRPPNLTRIRGLSQNIENNLQVSKPFKMNNSHRKQSEDIWKPYINQTYHNKMLQDYRLREVNDDDKSESGISRRMQQPPQLAKTESKTSQLSTKFKSLEERRRELILSKPSAIKADGAPFQDNKITWAGIEEMQDQNKSKSSRVSNKQSKSRRQSIVTESIGAGSSGSRENKRDSERSEKITEKSEQESPRKISKATSPTFLFMDKVSYESKEYPTGHLITVTPVQMGKVGLPKVQSQQGEDKRDNNSNSKESESDQQSHQPSDPSSHANHTQSEDNVARAEQLKKGISLTKCSVNGFWTHQKTVYLQENQRFICCRDISDKKVKKIVISSILSAEYKKYQKGIEKHISNFKPENCLVIRATMEDGKAKSFQFYGNNAQALDRFTANLNQFMETTKRKESNA